MDETGFLRALLDDPADETTRLVLADWLEERGDPRGGLLRVQAELARWVPDLRRRAELQERERRLVAAHGERFLGPLRPFCRDWRVEGGLAYLTVEARRFVGRRFAARAADLMRQAWVRAVRLHGAANHVDALARAAHLGAVTALDLDGNGLDDALLAGLLASPHLAGLRELDLSNNRLTDRAVGVLAAAPCFARLRSLSCRNNPLSSAGLLRLLAAERAPALEVLDAHGTDSAPDALGELAARAAPRNPPRLGGLPLRRTNSLGMEFRLVPAGTFLMGSPGAEADRLDDEGPRHEVTLTLSL